MSEYASSIYADLACFATHPATPCSNGNRTGEIPDANLVQRTLAARSITYKVHRSADNNSLICDSIIDMTSSVVPHNDISTHISNMSSSSRSNFINICSLA